MATFKDFRNNVKPNWCPGCGDFSVQAAIQRAAANVGLEPDNLAVISGIGCSGRISGYINSYGFHSIHGRSLPIAQGVKMANRDLTVIASGEMEMVSRSEWVIPFTLSVETSISLTS